MKMLSATLIFLLPCLASASDCRLFTVGECTPSNDIWVDEISVPCGGAGDVDACVRFCQTLCRANEKCNIFSYSLSKELCTLIQETSIFEYLAGCDVVAGPGSPPLEECMNDHPEDECERFIGQDCIYNGNPILNTTATDPKACQDILDESEEVGLGAKLFIHHASPLNHCQLRDSTDRTCDAIAGPEEPVYTACTRSFLS